MGLLMVIEKSLVETSNGDRTDESWKKKLDRELKM